MAKESFIINAWVKQDDPSYQLYSYGEDLKQFQSHIKDFPLVITVKDSTRHPSDEDYYHLRIAFYKNTEIESFFVQHPNVDFFQNRMGEATTQEEMEEGKDFAPIIHVLEKEADIFLTEDYSNNHSDAPRFRYIVDSGIWNYLATSQDVFNEAVIDIVNNWETGYYDLLIAREFADLNARLTKASYLYEQKNMPGGSTSKGHGAEVSPFLFHSESLIKKMQDTGSVSKYKWRFLLLDDKIDKEKTEPVRDERTGREREQRTGILSTNDERKPLTKADVIKNRIDSLGMGVCELVIPKDNSPLPAPKANIQIVCVETVEEAIEWMMQYEFDIILLDYLLKGSYGYKLLSEVKSRYVRGEYTFGEDKKEKGKIIIGPHKKLFFMFISAFTTAVNERLTLEGFSRDEEYWQIGEGACPTNTPELFKYRLLHLMERRLKQTGILKLKNEKILDTVKSIFPLETAEPEKTDRDRIKAVRERAYKIYNQILDYHYDYSLLRQNDKDHSILVDSFLEKKVHLSAMLEHLLQLVHLTAFGTVRQWPEIWEEYQYFVRAVNIDSEDVDNRQKLRDISFAIEKHIIELKSEQ